MKIISMTKEFVRVEYKLEEIPYYEIFMPALENIPINPDWENPPKEFTMKINMFTFKDWEEGNSDIAVYYKKE